MPKCNLRPLDDRIVIRQDEAPKARGRILLPDNVQEPPGRGTVLAVGPGAMRPDGKRTPPDVQPGDVVYFQHFRAHRIEHEGEEYYIAKEEAVAAQVL